MVVAIGGERPGRRPDRVATEEPLEIRAAGPHQEPTAVAVTMRTPGADFELAAGFLFTEGLVAPADIDTVRYCELLGDETQRYNVVTVRTRSPFESERGARRFAATSSCGICGKAALDDIAAACAPVDSDLEIDAEVLVALPDQLRRRQRVFDRTGGLHGAGLFDPDGTCLEVREDIGRHNAVDKLIGHAVLARGTPLARAVLAVSGRLGFEIVQKAAMAGIPIVAGVSAPSSLAVDAAQRFGITLAGFVRDGRANLYSSPERVRR